MNTKNSEYFPHNWKSDNDYSIINANNIAIYKTSTFENDTVIKSDKVTFAKPVYVNNDIFLYGNSLQFDSLNKLKLNDGNYKDTMLYVDELNAVFTDEDYALEQDNVKELDMLGIQKPLSDLEKCSYFEKGKNYEVCKRKIWRALRKQDMSNAPICNCCCSPDTIVSNCVVSLIRSNNKPTQVLTLRGRDQTIYNINEESNNNDDDDFVQISLQKSENIKMAELRFFNKRKLTGTTDHDDGLVMILFNDDFDSNIMKYPNNLGIKSILLIIK